MSFQMETFNPEKHDIQLVAELIYGADTEFNAMVFGSQPEGVDAIKKMMQMEYNYYTDPHVNCAINNDEVVGVLVGFEGKEKTALDQASGKSFARAFGVWPFLKKMVTYMRIGHISWKNIDANGYLVNSLCVQPSYRSHGFGTRILETVFENYDKVYLDVNMNNKKALRFYRKLGFEIQSQGTMKYKGKTVGLCSMLRYKKVLQPN